MSTAIDPELVARFKAALDRLNPDGGKIGLAVSGGPDSMAMLLLAQEAIPGQFEVATVDHGLRPEAKDECALVLTACEERGVPCEVLTVKVGEGNVQAKAREARYAALDRWGKRRRIRTLATAHHANDQMETILMRLNRGCGTSGLSAIRDRTYVSRWRALVRPLLSFSRGELGKVVESARIAVAHDPSNADTSFERIQIRSALSQIDCLDPKGFSVSAQHMEDADMLCEWAVNMWLSDNEKTEKGGLRHPVPIARYMHFPILETQFRLMGATPRGRDLAQLMDQLRKGKGGNVAGILVKVDKGDWVYRPEPPRRTG
ncbi:tRNA lysidine(34) synthetase TilS [Aurantiacibacter sediminis]|uniref:tRNA(Ile)-lysidine synthase n=1 Tax=Aurantiacibacter sediminis TaxID=2793064 RepID=A0ABS0N6W8_9SPHN|nr:tRNA lysidine(34) synthetase TilS [Aurantiacibacter sediminis]